MIHDMILKWSCFFGYRNSLKKIWSYNFVHFCQQKKKKNLWELSLYSQGSIDLHYKYIDPFNYYLYKPETHELFAISLKSLHDDQLSLSPLCLEKHYHNWSGQFKTWLAFNEKELVWNPYIMLLLFTFVSFNYFQSSNEARFQLSFKL